MIPTFTVSNANKDLTYYTALTEALGASNGMAHAAQAFYAAAVQQGHEASAIPELVGFLSR